MNKGIAIAGNLIVDTIKIIDTYPIQGMLSNIRSVSQSVGGCASNTSISLAALGGDLRVSVIGLMGNDANGDFILEKLKQSGTNIAGVLRTDLAPTSFTDVMNAQDTGERTFFHARGTNDLFGPEHIDFANIQADLFHLGYALLLARFDEPDDAYGTVFARTLKAAHDAGFKTSMDVVSENGERFARLVTPCLAHCDYIILNEIESGMVAGISSRDESGRILPENIAQICRAFIRLGVREKVVVHAPEGGWCMDAAQTLTYVPSLCLPKGYIKGTVGAGDAFCAGMLYGIYHGFDDEKSLRLARNSAACNLSVENSIDGARSFEQTMALEQAFSRQ